MRKSLICCLVLLLTACTSHYQSTKQFNPYESADKNEYRNIYTPDVIYPVNAYHRGIEGYVILRYTVTKEGRTANIKIVSSENSEYFDETAISLLLQYKYKPRTVDGIPVDVDNAGVRISFCIPEKYHDKNFKFEFRSSNCARLHS
jgi:TonB family protein